MEQELRRLAHRARKEQESRQIESVDVKAEGMDRLALETRNSGEDLVKGNGLGQLENKENAQRETEVANAGLLRFSVLERITFDDFNDQRGEEITVALQRSRDRLQRGFIIIAQITP